MASKKKTKKKQAKSMRPVGKKVAPMKMAVQKKLTKKTVSRKKKLAAPRKAEVKTKAGGKKTTGGKTAGALQRQVLGKSKAWIRWHSHRIDWAGARGSNREICKDCPTSQVRIRRVWTSCSRKETRSRPTW